jgi:aryl-alcohol dehydrogenase-like predicted oxidoreductase
MKNAIGARSDGAIPRIGLGCMGMSEFYGQRDDVASLEVLRAAHALGYRHFDTADMYGAGHNEELLGKFLGELGPSERERLVIASKAGIRRVPGPNPKIEVDSSPAYITGACDASLRRLGLDYIDIYYLHRRSPAVPIEETVGAMAGLVRAGKIGAVGLSEVSDTTLRRACNEFRIAALQSEYSLWSRDLEATLLGTCTELDVAVVAYSPLGRGFLSGTLTPEQVNADGDLRQRLPRFGAENFAANQALLVELSSIAEDLGASMAEVALAWILSRGPGIHVIPGSRTARHIVTNFGAATIELSPSHIERLTVTFRREAVAGERYPAQLLSTVNV